MRMGGPREALWHAIIRKNHGCTHFIVGRDHAGPGKDEHGEDFYHPYAAQYLVKQFEDEIGIQMVPFKEMSYVVESDSYVPANEVTDEMTTRKISGTQVRHLLKTGGDIPAWFSYPEVVAELQKVYKPASKQGFTVFLTGLSASGKSILAKALAARLQSCTDRSITLLDGDIIRKNLSYGLGFSRADRSQNVRRVGFVANEITKNGGIAICAMIAPYEVDREYDKNMISSSGGFCEVHVATPLSACEARDPKGLYAKARAGEIAAFTGISDPYEEPKSADIVIDASELSVKDEVAKIMQWLSEAGYAEQLTFRGVQK
jgi:sulfate adenylyltransferase